jgi:Tfp pilus assembly protein PilF
MYESTRPSRQPMRQNIVTLVSAPRKKRKTKQQSSQYERAIKLDPKTRDQHFALGTILEERNDLKEALREFESELVIDPANAEIEHRVDQGD